MRHFLFPLVLLTLACVCIGQNVPASGPAASEPATQKGTTTMAASQPCVTALRLRGYAVLPEPRKVELGMGAVGVNALWKVQAEGLDANDQSVLLLDAAMHTSVDNPHPFAAANTLSLEGEGSSVSLPRLPYFHVPFRYS